MKKAIVFLLFSVFLIGCSTKSDKDYLDIAEQNIKNQNVPEAVSAYETLVKEYPKSPSAPLALFEIATIYQNRMITNVSNGESLEKSALYFRQVYEEYPESEEAPKALFMSGFIRANELNNFDEATKVYNLFLTRYPDHELAAAARQELDNMGMSPEEILQKKVVNSF